MKKAFYLLCNLILIISQFSFLLSTSYPNIRQLTAENYSVFYSTYSHDGKKIAFSSNSNSRFWQIGVMNSNGTDMIILPVETGHAFCPEWSPNDDRIAFVLNGTGNIGHIWIMNSDGSNLYKLCYVGGIGDKNINNVILPWSKPSWSPDGKKILFSGYLEESYSLYSIDIDGENQARLLSNTTGQVRPSWSPDGKKIAFQAETSSNWDIWIMNANGTGQKRLTTDPSEDMQPIWSPDGEKIVFISNRERNHEVWVMNVDGSNKTKLTSNYETDFYPSWSPNEGKIIFCSLKGNLWNIWEIDYTIISESNDFDSEPDIESKQQTQSTSNGTVTVTETETITETITNQTTTTTTETENNSTKNNYPTVKELLQNPEWKIGTFLVGIGILIALARLIVAILEYLAKRKSSQTNDTKGYTFSEQTQIFETRKGLIRKAVGLLKGHFRRIEEQGDEYQYKDRLFGEIDNIIQHASVIISIAKNIDKEKMQKIIDEGNKYSSYTKIEEILSSKKEIIEWANNANSIQINIDIDIKNNDQLIKDVVIPSVREWNKDYESKLDPKLYHIYAVLFYPKEISWEKGERTPDKYIPRYKAIVNTKTQKAYYMLEYGIDLLNKRKIQFMATDWEGERAFVAWFFSRGIKLIEEPVTEEYLKK